MKSRNQLSAESAEYVWAAWSQPRGAGPRPLYHHAPVDVSPPELRGSGRKVVLEETNSGAVLFWEGEAPMARPCGQGETPSYWRQLEKLKKWSNYPSVGAPLSPTRFIPCKTPMSRNILDKWSLDQPVMHPLSVHSLLEGESAHGRTVGLILDLSNVRACQCCQCFM